MTLTIPQYFPDNQFAALVDSHMAAVNFALGRLRLSDFLTGRLQAEVTAGLIEQRNLAPGSSRGDDKNKTSAYTK